MPARTTKAHQFAPAVTALLLAAPVPLGCRRSPSPEPAQGMCAADGIVSSRVSERPDTGDLAAEIVQTCADCRASVRPGAPAGSPCSAASVCQEVCCNCPNSFAKTYRARACDAARCAGREACDSARASIRPDVCD